MDILLSMLANTNPKKQKKYNYVKSLLVLHGIKQKDIAEELGFKSPRAVSLTLNGSKTSMRVKTAIARKLNMPFEKLWGEAEKKAA